MFIKWKQTRLYAEILKRYSVSFCSWSHVVSNNKPSQTRRHSGSDVFEGIFKEKKVLKNLQKNVSFTSLCFAFSSLYVVIREPPSSGASHCNVTDVGVMWEACREVQSYIILLLEIRNCQYFLRIDAQVSKLRFHCTWHAFYQGRGSSSSMQSFRSHSQKTWLKKRSTYK